MIRERVVDACPHCRSPVDPRFRYCPWCGRVQRWKLVELFRAHPRDAGRGLRVSRYLQGDERERQVRLSVWSAAGVAEAAISLDEAEAERLGRFLVESAPAERRTLRNDLRERLRRHV